MTNKNYSVVERLGYSKCCDIGSGTDGIIILAINNTTNTKVAIKIVNLDNSIANTRFDREAMNSIAIGENKYIVKAKSYHKQGELGIIVMEYIHSINLMSFYMTMKQFNNSQLKLIFTKMCKAVKHCHKRKVAHLDIKPDNFLFNNRTKSLHLCDFFRSFNWEIHHRNNQELNTCTTIYYRTPESFLENQENDLAKYDVWALGVCFFGLLFGFFPFEKKVVAGERKEELDFDFERMENIIRNSTLSREVSDLLHLMLQPDPQRRCSIFEALEHPYFDD